MNTAEPDTVVDGHADNRDASWVEHCGRKKIQAHHLERLAMVYVRQSTPRQVLEHVESKSLQYELARRAVAMGWHKDRVLVIDDDLGQSAQTADQRQGFQRLLAEVTMEHVGLILGVEMSRLARSCKDWYHLLELCALFRSLLADQDGIYDPADYNDRLLLGLKGTMSEAELHVMRGRLEEGKMHKARRGELFTRLPIGYVFLPSGDVTMDPDQEVQTMIRYIFEKFKELGTGRAVARYFRQHDIRLPIRYFNDRGRPVPPLEWRLASPEGVYEILGNPIYAGAYVYGRSQTDARRKQAGKPNSGRIIVPMEKWKVLLLDRLPAYITWDEYLANHERLQQNVSRWNTLGAPRDGFALLAGLVYCVRCGYRMHVTYPVSRRAVYACNRRLRNDESPPHCPRIPAAALDPLISCQVLHAVEPAALELSMRTQADVEHERERLARHWRQRLERTRYEAERSRRQYDAAEPENRLVARELEKRWDEALARQRQVEEEYTRFQQATPAKLSVKDQQLIRSLASDIPQLWDAPTTTPTDRQKVIRHLVEQVQVNVHGTTELVDVTIYWKGGFVSRHEIRRPLRRYSNLRDYDQLVRGVVELYSAGHTSPHIAEKINAEGFHPPKGKSFNAVTIRTLLSRQGVSRSLANTLVDTDSFEPNEWWLSDLAKELELPSNTIKGWIQRGWVHAHQLSSGSQSYWIVWADSDELNRLRRLHACRRTPFPEEITTPKVKPNGRASRSKKGR